MAMLAVVQNARRRAADGDHVPLAGAYAASRVCRRRRDLDRAAFNVSFRHGHDFGLKAFAAAIIGGIRSAWGVMLAGLCLGLLEAFATTMFGSVYTQILTFASIIVILFVLPNGILGRAGVEKDYEASGLCTRRRGGGRRPRLCGADGPLRRLSSRHGVADGACRDRPQRPHGPERAQISFGHVGFMAIGAYATAILMDRAGWPFSAAMPAAALLAGAIGGVLAVPALRVRGPYLRHGHHSLRLHRRAWRDQNGVISRAAATG